MKELPLLAWLVLSSLAMPAVAASQGRDSVTAAMGARVRLRAVDDSTWRIGRLTAITADSLTLRACGACGTPAIARHDLRHLEVRRGLPGTRRRHARIGMVAGALFVAGTGIMGIRHCEAEARSERRNEGPPCAIAYGFLVPLTIAGAFVGGFIGAALPAERWQPAGLDR